MWQTYSSRDYMYWTETELLIALQSDFVVSSALFPVLLLCVTDDHMPPKDECDAHQHERHFVVLQCRLVVDSVRA